MGLWFCLCLSESENQFTAIFQEKYQKRKSLAPYIMESGKFRADFENRSFQGHFGPIFPSKILRNLESLGEFSLWFYQYFETILRSIFIPMRSSCKNDKIKKKLFGRPDWYGSLCRILILLILMLQRIMSDSETESDDSFDSESLLQSKEKPTPRWDQPRLESSV